MGVGGLIWFGFSYCFLTVRGADWTGAVSYPLVILGFHGVHERSGGDDRYGGIATMPTTTTSLGCDDYAVHTGPDLTCFPSSGSHLSWIVQLDALISPLGCGQFFTTKKKRIRTCMWPICLQFCLHCVSEQMCVLTIMSFRIRTRVVKSYRGGCRPLLWCLLKNLH